MNDTEIQAEVDKRLRLLDVEMAERAYQAAEAAVQRAQERADAAMRDLHDAKRAAGLIK